MPAAGRHVGLGADHDPAAIDARADRLERYSGQLDAEDGASVARLRREIRATVAFLRRHADDLRLLDRFLRAAGLLRTDTDDDDDAG